MIRKILIANRGEIACRIIKACKEMKISTVAVYSDVDSDSPHVLMADEAVEIGPANPSESYLNFDKIVNAAKDTNSDAIHPGYGFLSENGDFAKYVNDSGLIFIGPDPDTIKSMGDKAESKQMMMSAGVPTIPGSDGELTGNIDAMAREIGYPLMVKAAAGGGGKGMRIVNQAEELDSAIEAAKNEARNSFGNDTLIIESLDFRINEIARKWMNSAELLLDKGLYNDALGLAKKVAEFSDIGGLHLDRFRSYVMLAQGERLQSILILGKAMEKYSKALELNDKLESKVYALQYQAGIQLVELADRINEPDEIILAIQSLKQAKELSPKIGTRNEELLKDLENKLQRFNDYKSDVIISYKMSQARYLQLVARSPKLTIGMTLPLVEELLGAPHEIVISDKNMEQQQLWIYNLKDKQLHFSFKDYILFKIEKI